MSEQAPQPQFKSPEAETYIQEHPQAILDPAKAEWMAHASKREEEDVVKFGNQAINFALSAETSTHPNGRAMQVRGEIRDAQENSTYFEEKAKNSRVQADLKATSIGELYDRVSAIKGTVNKE